ncbi:hypothetical protein [Paraflavitalea sp. CAU 1676]|uniref:hypothetical protein n=1 Tax=Paraflavitalea sp. CAU 1676 TaxID=3032598 RepID=UPI0023D98264|nr:hypothetical protein [Paraflavitalea sp. CAU 1676]MDF2193357.1 hypothetical protein [Paraflavitalea sp. CAU 1676]
MKSNLTFILLLLSPGLSAQAPGGISTQLKMWIRSDDASTISVTGNKINEWRYLNNPARAFVATGSERPNWRPNGINFQPTAEFSGAQLMNGPGGTNAPIPAGDDDYSLFAVWNSTFTGFTGERLWLQWNCVTQKHGFSLTTLSTGLDFYYGAQFEIAPYGQGIKQKYTPGTWQFCQLDVQNLTTQDLHVSTPQNLAAGPQILSSDLNRGRNTRNISDMYNVIGASCDIAFEPFHGDMAELIIYDRPVSGVERAKIFSYLALKYGITIPGFDYVASNWNGSTGTVFWHRHATYNNDIFGVGLDESVNGSKLDLVRSNSLNTGSGDGTGQAGKGNIILTANPSTMDDGEYLLVANDGRALTQSTAELPASFVGANRVAREWKVQHTGDLGRLDLSFDMNGLTFLGNTGDPANYSMLIDEDGDGDFTTGTPTVVVAQSIANGRLQFNNVLFNNGVVFTFATQVNMLLLKSADINFYATRNGDRALLKWLASTPGSIQQYDVQVSADGAHFETEAVLASVNLPVTNYVTYTSRGKVVATTYYRIKLTDVNGQVSYSSIAAVHPLIDNELTLFPNPFEGQIKLQLKLTTKQTVKIKLMDLGARLLGQWDIECNAGVNNTTLKNLHDLSYGTYCVSVFYNNAWSSYTLVKAR